MANRMIGGSVCTALLWLADVASFAHVYFSGQHNKSNRIRRKSNIAHVPEHLIYLGAREFVILK